MSEVNLPILPLRDYQKQAWNHMMQPKMGLRGITVWPRRNGKDLVAINMMAAKSQQRIGDYAYIAPFANQCRGIIWEGNAGTGMRFIDYVPSPLVERKLDQQMKIFLKNGSTVQLFGSDNPDALVGRNFVGMIFTEFSLHKDAIWSYMRPMLAENGGWALFNGTPRGMNHFYLMAEMAKSHPDWFYEKLTCEDTGFPSLEDIQAEREAGMSESLIEQEFYTSWTSSSEETLIPLDKLQECSNVTLASEDYNFAPRIIGVDPAYAEKGDRAVIMRRQGRMIHEPEVHQGIDPMALASRVAHHLQTWKAHFCYVDAGRGEAVWSRLFQLGYQDRVIPVDFGGKTYDDLCHRKKDEIWNRMKLHLCDPVNTPRLPQLEELFRDLSAPTFEINERGKMVLESKKALAKRGFRSTDLGDALALTYAEDHNEAPLLTEEQKAMGVTEDQLRMMDEQRILSGQNYSPDGFMDSISAEQEDPYEQPGAFGNENGRLR